ncbi:hypothetical protein K3N28_15455 [Glycomyces sp. TRM65418]|uniref:hypothetical protein n=1 Tax=Glycomyces sp. TRM65418 TaxID=2867006 RepID=UPI001CE56275|nr:hypothetical protein [Glycomyces sp. TRM65418]MCC3764459.1 hypothetical protein [Glycomyces sp. TRM65418]QZD54132.1 hypothetical protein K3N28_15380 [Glycomyces sp. TRM65418]
MTEVGIVRHGGEQSLGGMIANPGEKLDVTAHVGKLIWPPRQLQLSLGSGDAGLEDGAGLLRESVQDAVEGVSDRGLVGIADLEEWLGGVVVQFM